ncbi:MAG: cytochrome c family protein [Myxococcota bacterium]|nr:cytochrome c family protein [Myxococcota bacterium]
MMPATQGNRAPWRARVSNLLLALLPLVAVMCVVPMALAEAPATLHGLAPLPDDQAVPRRLLPPGSSDVNPGPSDVIFPTQHLTVRFNHRKHLSTDIGAKCKTCHAAAYRSASASDTLLPAGAVCDACHSTDHSNLAKVLAGDDAMGQCAFCHLGYKPTDGDAVAQLQVPRANLVFNHKVHIERNVGCPQCHGAVEQLELATRDQLPRMRGCFQCHQMTDAASRGTAKSACDVCHVRGDRGTPIKTMFATGNLLPPRWLYNAEHTPDFIERHKQVAAENSQFCANCHKEDFCTDCHDGRVRPRSVHPNDYLNMHAIEARMATQRCTSCHQQQSFCLDCHMRVGIAESSPGPPNGRESGRFHPPKSIWSDPPRKPGHHAFEAERNLNACVSCHTERDCVACHGALGVGGGFDPHQGGFLSSCARQFRRNPRPCFVCHQPTDGELAQCR